MTQSIVQSRRKFSSLAPGKWQKEKEKKKTFDFLALPAELRIQIYEYLVPVAIEENVDPLRLVCRQTNYEFEYELQKALRAYREDLKWKLIDHGRLGEMPESPSLTTIHGNPPALSRTLRIAVPLGSLIMHHRLANPYGVQGYGPLTWRIPTLIRVVPAYIENLNFDLYRDTHCSRQLMSQEPLGRCIGYAEGLIEHGLSQKENGAKRIWPNARTRVELGWSLVLEEGWQVTQTDVQRGRDRFITDVQSLITHGLFRDLFNTIREDIAFSRKYTTRYFKDGRLVEVPHLQKLDALAWTNREAISEKQRIMKEFEKQRRVAGQNSLVASPSALARLPFASKKKDEKASANM